MQTPFREHWNTAVGHYVSNQREFRDGLARKSDEASERLGMDHDFQPLTRAEMMDAAAHKVDVGAGNVDIMRAAGQL